MKDQWSGKILRAKLLTPRLAPNRSSRKFPTPAAAFALPMLQSLSRAMVEEVRWADGELLSVDWESYPILRFSEVPAVEVAIVESGEQASLGAGEAAQGPTAAAIGNAARL